MHIKVLTPKNVNMSKSKNIKDRLIWVLHWLLYILGTVLIMSSIYLFGEPEFLSSEMWVQNFMVALGCALICRSGRLMENNRD